MQLQETRKKWQAVSIKILTHEVTYDGARHSCIVVDVMTTYLGMLR